jgi:OOP family OmpA-OmpF porin
MIALLLVVVAAQAPVEPPPASTYVQHPNAPLFEMNGNALVLQKPIAFQPGTDQLKDDDDSIGHIASFLSIRSYVSTLRIEAHAAEPGPGAQALSEKRALSVARALVAKGVDCKRLVAVGFGASKPVAPLTPEGKSLNNRVVAVVAALRGHAVDGAPVDGGGKIAGDVCEKPKSSP